MSKALTIGVDPYYSTYKKYFWVYTRFPVHNSSCFEYFSTETMTSLFEGADGVNTTAAQDGTKTTSVHGDELTMLQACAAAMALEDAGDPRDKPTIAYLNNLPTDRRVLLLWD